jgi:hypothetical protein
MNLMAGRTGFVAYPSKPAEVGECIEAAVGLTMADENSFGTWRSLEIGGQFIPEKVHHGVSSSSVFAADITYLNLNVAYEIGLAVGKGTPLVLTTNKSLTGNQAQSKILGLFDTLGQDSYANAEELADIFRKATSRKPLMLEYALNASMPVYTIVPKSKDEFLLRTISKLKRLKLSFRVFDAGEQTRLTVGEAIQKVSESYGVLLTLLRNKHPESLFHNLRTMFTAGLAVGLEKPIALLTSGIDEVPMDVAALVHECKFPEQIDDVIQTLATDIADALQQIVYTQGRAKTQLEKLDLGASSAENELSKLDAYYLSTESFQKTLRGEARLVVGRKGSGKSAVFFQVKKKLSEIKQKLVIDLKPDGFQLIGLKDTFAPILADGSLEHLVTAFWEYVLYCEVAAQFLKEMPAVAKRDPEIGQVYSELADFFDKHSLSAEGDFSERVVAALKEISAQVTELSTAASSTVEKKLSLTSPQVTQLIHRGPLKSLIELVQRCLKYKQEVWILFDNIDKGWPAHGLSATDILVVRTLQDAARKVSRTLEQRGRSCFTVIFLRNDIFELLVSETPDRGKEARALLDWNDREALKEVVRRRLAYSGLPQDRSLDELWQRIATPYIKGRPSFEYLLDRCLMRPRFLLDLIGHCKSFAVNVGHQKIEMEDIEKGLKVFSADLVMDISFEIADVLGASYENSDSLLMRLVGCDQILRDDEILDTLLGKGHKEADKQQIMKILLWHGVIGICSANGEEGSYIYDFHYNLSLMTANINKAGSSSGVMFRINDAFTEGLQLATMG